MSENESEHKEEKVEYSVQSALKYMRTFISDVLDLQHGVDKRGTIREISEKKSMAGANAWMLICSIMIASIGLSLNSQAVIIGAMLISPLMSPILGIGLSVAINDMETLRKSLVHFGVAIVIAILTSVIYFVCVGFVGFSEITPEIAARTTPTLLDVFVGIFGGLAGIISVARKDISTTLPGVAIATALMPPLCVTGFGLAHGDWDIASRSFYLFFLNTYFVALATYVIVRLLRFPFRDYVKRNDRYKNAIYLVIFSLLLTIPSVMIFKGLMENIARDQAVRDFKSKCLVNASQYLDDYEYLERPDTLDLMVVKMYGSDISEEQIMGYEQCMIEQGLRDVELIVLPSSDVNLDHIQSLKTDVSGLNEHIQLLEAKAKEQEDHYLSHRHMDSTEIAQVIRELQILHPELTSVAIGELQYADYDTITHTYPTIMIDVPRRTKVDRQRIVDFVRERLELDTLVLQ